MKTAIIYSYISTRSIYHIKCLLPDMEGELNTIS